MKKRCFWANPNNKEYIDYHDNEWGVPVYDDIKHFEMLSLEGAQAGLSWETILKKRDGYIKLFKGFDPKVVEEFSDEELEQILQNPKIVRNRLKVFSVRNNAKLFIDIQNQYGSFNSYIWGFTEGKQIINLPSDMSEIKSKTDLSDIISKDLKKRGFKFVGSTIIYAYLQAVGIIDDHTKECFRAKS
jgi:DNA-3-methyladenine glycosylase I